LQKRRRFKAQYEYEYEYSRYKDKVKENAVEAVLKVS
jgi:hypothetical protein